MNAGFKNEGWYKELDSHIRCAHAASKQRKTVLINNEHPYLYSVVSRANYLTAILWINHVNELIEALPKDKFEKQRFCWLTEQKKYRHNLTKQLTNSHDKNPNP